MSDKSEAEQDGPRRNRPPGGADFPIVRDMGFFRRLFKMKQVETTREAIINRRSVRKYKTDMIPRDIIERIVEAGTYAANGRGHQASIILAVTNKD